MRKGKAGRVVLNAAALILIVGSVAYVFDFYADMTEPQVVASERMRAPQQPSPQSAVVQQKVSIPASNKEELVDTQSQQENPLPTSNEEELNSGSGLENPYLNHEVKARLEQVAEAYAKQIQFPSYSMPIPDEESLQKYLPNRSIEAERALDIKDENSPRIRLSTDKQQYFIGDSIDVTVGLSGIDGEHLIEVKAMLLTDVQTLASVDGRAITQQEMTYRMSFNELEALPHSGTDDFRVVARISIDGEVYEIGTPVSYVSSIAEVTHVGAAQVSGEILNIPVHVTTTRLGYHELAANLYSAQSDRPLMHLTAKEELQANDWLMQLQAHIVSLKNRGDPGPYILKDIIFTRMPSAPDFATAYGKTSQNSYEITGHPLAEYDDAVYIDEDGLIRLETLQKIGSVN